MENFGDRVRILDQRRMGRRQSGGASALVYGVALACCIGGYVPDAAGREKEAIQYGAGLIVNVPFSEAEVSQVVQEIVHNGIIRGTKEYNKDEFITGAEAATSTRVFPAWTEGGKVFYKVRFNALDPLNFKNSGDVGTLAVRYVVQSQDEKHTVLRIDARFLEGSRHSTHPSNGSVEGAEYKDIHDHLESLALVKTEAAEAQKGKQEFSSSRPAFTSPPTVLNDEPVKSPTPAPAPDQAVSLPPPTPPSVESGPPASLEQRVQELRRQAERKVKAPGAPLKAAPFHSASTLQPLPAGSEVLVVISTPYWYGVETHEGQHGWVQRDQLEMLP